MTIDSNLPNWQLVANFVKSKGTGVSLKEIQDFLVSQNRLPSNARPDATMLSVNLNSRIHYGDKKARRTNTGNRYDVLYRQTNGNFVAYDPAIHGIWEIFVSDDGNRSVRLATEPKYFEEQALNTPVLPSEPNGFFEGSNQFRMESHLRDYLAQNLGLITAFGKELSLYTEAENIRGIEYLTEVGPVDILAVDNDGAYYVIELKLGRGPDAAIGQTLRYIAAIKKTIAKGSPVYGVIIASSITDKLRYAASELKDRIFVMQYELKVTLNKVVDII